MRPSRTKLIYPPPRPPCAGCFNASKVLTWFRQKNYYKSNIYLDGLDKLRTKIVGLIGAHAMHLYKIQKSGVGV